MNVLSQRGMCGGLNSSVPSEDALGRKVSSLASSLLLLGKSSCGRGKLICDSNISHESLCSNVLKMFEESVKFLNDVYRNLDELFGVDYTSYFHVAYNLLVKVREIVAWEGALTLFLLDKIDPREKPVGVSVVSSSIQVNKKSDKKKKGTGQIREIIMDRLKNSDGEQLVTLNEWARDLSLFFNPSPGLDAFLKTLKGIVESNESTRLPKLPKAANYLNIKSLVDLVVQTFSDMMKGKTPAEIHSTFNINDVFPPVQVKENRSTWTVLFK